MSKNIVIVESPAKAKTIEGYLGKDYVVKSSYGHVRDLPKGDKAIDIDNGFKPTYEISADKKEVIKELKKLTKDAEIIYLASDDDREGEAISWHLKEALKLSEANTRRIVFREITKNAIKSAIDNPRTIDIDLVNAQQARRILDRLVGFELSPVLWKKIKAGLSAGRVQSVAVRLVVERERDIDKFNAASSFKITAEFLLDKGKVLKAEMGKKFKTVEEANAFLQECKEAEFTIDDLVKKPSKKSPAAPFTTSTLQQEASRKLGYSVGYTMSLAQRLYEAGKITYMRTDSVNLSQEAVEGASKEVASAYGKEFIQNRVFKTKSASAQEAHEAIRPTNFAEHTVSGENAERKLYELIWKRAIASQMADAQIE
ncbi:MAG: type I DNA topoisomerase, partial [Bacteroidota bacterium]